jgi:hypothetical protein
MIILKVLREQIRDPRQPRPMRSRPPAMRPPAAIGNDTSFTLPEDAAVAAIQIQNMHQETSV